MRRDWTIDILRQCLDVRDEVDFSGHRVLVAYRKASNPTEKSQKWSVGRSEKATTPEGASLFSFVPATSGMFLWFEVSSAS